MPQAFLFLLPFPPYLLYGIMEQGHFPFSTLKTLYFLNPLSALLFPKK
ncbi:hypothetical protein HMPREF9391_0485 [Streptococcus sanguinis SK408]|uniref:Uncharacterized protein n=1 Tax=Streptococcus sanguinis SK408 TaxID=888818 RepID=F2CCI5_STRSA|nr:hypothetical protein HMPREF9391_0485 [Streptococcus sanguinis SK408]